MKKLILLTVNLSLLFAVTQSLCAQEATPSEITATQAELNKWTGIRDALSAQMAKDPLNPTSTETAPALAKATSQSDAQKVIDQRQEQLNKKLFTVNGQQYSYNQVAQKINDLNMKINTALSIPSAAELAQEPKPMALRPAN